MRLVATCQRVNDDAIFTLGVRLEVQRKKRVIQTFLSFDVKMGPKGKQAANIKPV